MKLFLKFNKVDSPDMKIMAIISQMRGGTAENFATHWTDKVANTDDVETHIEYMTYSMLMTSSID
jgi:hypothetical protein